MSANPMVSVKRQICGILTHVTPTIMIVIVAICLCMCVFVNMAASRKLRRNAAKSTKIIVTIYTMKINYK